MSHRVHEAQGWVGRRLEAQILGTFRRILKEDARAAEVYEVGLAKLSDEIVDLLLEQGRKGNVTSLIWLTKARLGWSEQGLPVVQTNVQIVLNDAKSEDEYLRAIEAEAR